MLRTIAGLAVVLLCVGGCSPVAAPPGGKTATSTGKQSDDGNVAANTTTGNSAPSKTAKGTDADNSTIDDLMAEALEKAQEGDLDGCVAKLKDVLAQDAENRQALFALANLTQRMAQMKARQGDKGSAYPLYHESAEFLRKLHKAYPELNEAEQQLSGDIFYNDACAEAMGGNAKKALDVLAAALDAGYSDFDCLDKDDDLASVRELPEFASMKADQMLKAAERARAYAQQELSHGETFDFDFSLPDLDDKTVTLSEFKGKVLIVDVWGTWCPPCRMEIPHFVALQEKFQEQGLEIIGLNYESGEPDAVKETIREFLKDQPINYTLLIGDDTTKDQIPSFEGYPTTLFIDRSGKVRLKVVGYHPRQQLEALVTELLAEPVPELEKSGG